MTRAFCLNPDSCTAAKPTTHCRRCTAIRMTSDPTTNQKRIAAMRARYEEPAFRAERVALIARNAAPSRADPGYRDKMREHGLRQFRDVLTRPDVVAKIQAPEARAKRGAAITATRLAWCPAELRDQYRDLVRCKGLTAAEARAAIEDIIDAPQRAARRAISDFDHRQRARAAREAREAY